jgi:hypothetical protein
MPSNYTGNPAAITARQVPVIACPVDADALSANSANVPTEKLADFVAWLQANAALFAVENGFTVEQAFLAASALLLSRSGPQTITKIGSGDLLITNTVGGVAALAASGGSVNLASSGGASLNVGPSQIGVNKPLAMGANPITGITDPTNAQDAATKAFVEAHYVAALKNSSGSGAYTLTGSFATIPNQSQSIATQGRSVVLAMQPHQLGGTACITISPQSGVVIQLRRAGTVIASWQWQNQDATNYVRVALPPPFVDVAPANETFTYDFQAEFTGAGGAAGQIDNAAMVSYLL